MPNTIAYFGGGATADARKPLLLEDHGNKVAFVAATRRNLSAARRQNTPGASRLTRLVAQQLRAQGYLPIVTFNTHLPIAAVAPWICRAPGRCRDREWQSISVPLQMEFDDGTFIHYGSETCSLADGQSTPARAAFAAAS
jgi:hypothetical protein